jgi:hypothetical protein
MKTISISSADMVFEQGEQRGAYCTRELGGSNVQGNGVHMKNYQSDTHALRYTNIE